MAGRSSSDDAAASPPVFDPKGLDSGLIGRYRFSRSICQRLDLSRPLASGRPPRPRLEHKGSSEDSVSGSASPASALKLPKRSPSGPLSLGLADESFSASSSVASSPSIIKSFSCASFGSVTESSDEDRSFKGKRVASWSQFVVESSPLQTLALEGAGEEWTIDMSQLFLGQKFASGSYSRLYLGIYKGREVAVKLIRPPDEDESVALRLENQFRHEVLLLSRLHHQNVVQFVAACKKLPVCCIITEYLCNGSLRSFLSKSGPAMRPVNEVVRMALDIARGMEYLHSQGVIHRDLKSENLCLDKDLCVKIADFGVSCHFTENYSHTKDTGTYRWMAPEMSSQKPYTKKVDVFSFGIVLWELYSGLIPFEDMTPVQAAFAVVNKHLRPEVPQDCPRVLRDLMKQCWSADPKDRPDFWEIVKILEQFEELSKQDFVFSTWQHPSRDVSLISRCFKGCRSAFRFSK